MTFRNTVIIMTSNIGSQYLVEDATSAGEIKPDARERVMAEIRAREVETRIGRARLAGDVRDGAAIAIGYTDGELTVKYENRA